MMYVPAEGVEPSQRPCRARDGVGVIIQSAHNDLLLVNINA